jgi:hypothetical protein
MAGRAWHRLCSGLVMARIRLSLRSTETYTEPNFLRLQLMAQERESDPLVTLEHFSCLASKPDRWHCLTIVDAEPMSRNDAIFIARHYAAEYGVPVIYECPSD